MAIRQKIEFTQNVNYWKLGRSMEMVMKLNINRETKAALKKACTPRQVQVVALLAKGRSIKQAASDLGIGIWTIRKHVYRAMERMDAETIPELVAKLTALGMIDVIFLVRRPRKDHHN